MQQAWYMTVVACVGQCWAWLDLHGLHNPQEKRSNIGLLELRSWRNGSAPDSRSGGWEFKSLRPHSVSFCRFTKHLRSFPAALSPCRLRHHYRSHTQVQCKPDGGHRTSCDVYIAMRSTQLGRSFEVGCLVGQSPRMVIQALLIIPSTIILYL